MDSTSLAFVTTKGGRRARKQQSGVAVEVKIGVHNATRELTLESAESPEAVEEKVRTAVADPNGLLELADERGRKVIVRTEHLTYIELGEPVERRVGFGTV